MSFDKPVIVALTPGGAIRAKDIARAVGGDIHLRRSEHDGGGQLDHCDEPDQKRTHDQQQPRDREDHLHALGQTKSNVTATAPSRITTFEHVGEHLRSVFLSGRPIIGICATGILVRALAPVIGHKRIDPPVLAVAEDGSAVVPLLGGHHGGNEMARQIATVLRVPAAVTTAGDVTFGVALDAPPPGWVLENPADAKSAMAALLAGASARVSASQKPDWLAPLIAAGKADFRRIDGEEGEADAPTVLQVENCEALIYRERRLILGVGCARGCDPAELIALASKTLADYGRSQFEVARVVSIDVKSDEAAVHALAAHFGVDARFFDAATLEAQRDRLANPSNVVFNEVGCHGVAEGAALAAAGARAHLAIEKHKSANATCAAADITNDGCLAGKPRGHLSIVGIGPGNAEWRTPEASRLINDADVLVGYGLYIDLLGSAAHGKARHDFPLGGEEDRCRFALEEAGRGRNVALICSGDAGIYAMGALVYELLHRPQDQRGVSDAARRVSLTNAPGVSALQAASARIGALLGHDFCAISLSDLLTPRADIIRRVEAAAAGDFVIAFYNPVSRKRRTLLAQAREILLSKRPGETPVLLASNLGRPDEQLHARTLQTLSVDEVDMLTVVLVGSSQSQAFARGDISESARGTVMFTPRGYARKAATN